MIKKCLNIGNQLGKFLAVSHLKQYFMPCHVHAKVNLTTFLHPSFKRQEMCIGTKKKERNPQKRSGVCS